MYRVMGLDIGTKRIGVALSDYLLVLAIPYGCVMRSSDSTAVEEILKIAKANNVQKIVIGLPINMDGTHGFQADNCKEFAEKLKGYEIIFEDERLTSEQAEENLRNKKINFKQDKKQVDIESACIILEQYLTRK